MVKTFKKLYIGISISAIGLLGLFFEATKSIGAFLIGYGLAFATYNVGGDE
jgi:hypothetical protein